MIFRDAKIDFQEFMQVLDKCEGNIFIITKEGDRFNMKSKLSQLIGIAKLIENGTIFIDRLETENFEDEGVILRYLLYGRIPE